MHGFLEKEIAVRSSNGRDDVLIEPLHFQSEFGILYRVPAESTTDGMSTPPIIHSIPGFEPYGKHWFSAVLHDAGYRGTLQIYAGQDFRPANLSRAQTDALMRDALSTQGVGPIRRALIYSALRIFGARNFRRSCVPT